MKYLLIRYNNVPIKFDMEQVSTIYSESNLIRVNLNNDKTYIGYMIKPEN